MIHCLDPYALGASPLPNGKATVVVVTSPLTLKNLDERGLLATVGAVIAQA
jgi:hypothetical protein